MSKPRNVSIGDALIELGCNETHSVANEDPSQITWINVADDFIPPSNEDILAKKAELREIWDANLYYWERREAYPAPEEQLEMQYKDGIDGTTTWQDAIQAVKTKYPKPA